MGALGDLRNSSYSRKWKAKVQLDFDKKMSERKEPKEERASMSDVFSQKVAFLIPRLQKDLGITKYQAAGIVGSLAAETSGFKHMQELNPQGHRGGWGWAQWTGERRNSFEKKFGVGNDSDEANYGMLIHELKNDPYWSQELYRLKKAVNTADAARIFTGSATEGVGYLRPGVEHYEESEDWAYKALAALGKSAIEETTRKERDKKIFDMFEKTLQHIALVRVVEVDEVNTMKLRAVVNVAQDVLNWAKNPLDNEE